MGQKLRRTIFHPKHIALKANMVEFGGWDMPLNYAKGIIAEHIGTRTAAGLFDVSHMGRFIVRGPEALPFLQYALTNDASRLDPEKTGAQYTLIPNQKGGAVDDAFLYRFKNDEYLLVVNASNRRKDLRTLRATLKRFPGAELIDRTSDLAMLALQGPRSADILSGIITGKLPGPARNLVSTARLNGTEIMVASTGYTGEPVCFELFVENEHAWELWDKLVSGGAMPIGLGARDTLRLEAGLPLYGHEFGLDPENREIPILACPAAKPAVVFTGRGNFRGETALKKQALSLERIRRNEPGDASDLPRLIRAIAITGRGIARPGCRIFKDDRCVGYVTSGSMIPYPVFAGENPLPTGEHRLRPICLAYIESRIAVGTELLIDIRGKSTEGSVVSRHLRSDTAPYSQPVIFTKK